MLTRLTVTASRVSARASTNVTRGYAAKAKQAPAAPVNAVPTMPEVPESGLSSCQENTVLTGLNYLKDQAPVLALADEAYPAWLWTILKPKEYENDGPGGQHEKRQLRKERIRKIKDDNFMKTQ